MPVSKLVLSLFLQTHKGSISLHLQTHTLNIACVGLTHAVKVTLTVCRSFWFHSSKSWTVSMVGSRPAGTPHTDTDTDTYVKWGFTLTFDLNQPVMKSKLIKVLVILTLSGTWCPSKLTLNLLLSVLSKESSADSYDDNTFLSPLGKWPA